MEKNNQSEINHPFISPFYTKFQMVSVAEDGVMTQKGQFIEYSAQENIQSSEFSLGNLIAIGAANNLSYVSMSLNSDMNFVDQFATSYSKLNSDVTKPSES